MLFRSNRSYLYCCWNFLSFRVSGARLFERWAGIPMEVYVSSEFAYEQPLLSEKPFFIFLSQSGETANSCEAFQNINAQGFKSLTLTNVELSKIAIAIQKIIDDKEQLQ